MATKYTDVSQFKKGDVILVTYREGVSGVFRVVATKDHTMFCDYISHIIDIPLDDMSLHDCEGLVGKNRGKDTVWFVMPHQVVTKLL